METVLIIISIFIGLFLFFQQMRLFYNRYLRTYSTEIKYYLSNKGFRFIETRYPDNSDWARSPFSKPPNIVLLFAFVTINGRMVKWTNHEYLIAVGEKAQNHKEFWIEISTIYFRKPEVSFREGRSIRKKENKDMDIAKYVIVEDECPACGFTLAETTNPVLIADSILNKAWVKNCNY